MRVRVVLVLMFVVCVCERAEAQLGGPKFSWSPGMAVATDFLGEFEQDAVIDANGIVQVTAERKSQVLPVLEGHVAWPLADWVAVGPFAAIAPGDEIVNQVGFGILGEFTAAGRTFTAGIGP